VSDRQVGPDEVERVRIWDACALGGFTRMAGGFNPRRAVHDRRNRRFFRKLAHYFIQRELACVGGLRSVGCGRCDPRCATATSACPSVGGGDLWRATGTFFTIRRVGSCTQRSI
jgi:hypothetical protein